MVMARSRHCANTEPELAALTHTSISRPQDAAQARATAALRRLSDEEGRHFSALDEAVSGLFCRLPWPGNVRQLLNVLRNVVVLNEGEIVTPAMLPADLQTELRPRAAEHPADAALPGLAVKGLIGRTLAEIEQIVIEATITAEDGSVPRAAKVLGVSPSTLYRKRETWQRSDAAE